MTKPTNSYECPANSYQPRHPPSLIRVFAVHMKKHWAISYPLSTSEDSDQTGRMPRLIWVFAGHTYHFVGFVMKRLIFRNSAYLSVFVCGFQIKLSNYLSHALLHLQPVTDNDRYWVVNGTDSNGERPDDVMWAIRHREGKTVQVCLFCTCVDIHYTVGCQIWLAEFWYGYICNENGSYWLVNNKLHCQGSLNWYMVRIMLLKKNTCKKSLFSGPPMGLGNRKTRTFTSGEQRSKNEENSGKKAILGNIGNQDFHFGVQGNKKQVLPLGGPLFAKPKCLMLWTNLVC